MTQVELAALVGVSQPRISQVLSRLRSRSAISVADEGYSGQRAALLDLYLANHRPALVSPEVGWYSVRPVREQIERLCSAASDTSARVAVSADFAPDLLVPWRHPTLTAAYTDRPLDLTPAGFVRADGRVDATVLLRHTSDTTLLAAFEPWPRVVDDVPLADPVQQIWDLHDLGGEDRHEAADRLRAAILDGSLEAFR
jgi:hypothetical protein